MKKKEEVAYKEIKDLETVIEQKDMFLKTVLEKVQALDDVGSIKEENKKMTDTIQKLEIELSEAHTKLQKQNLAELSTNAVAIQLVESMQTRVVLKKKNFETLQKVLLSAVEPMRQYQSNLNNIIVAITSISDNQGENARQLVNEVLDKVSTGGSTDNEEVTAGSGNHILTVHT